MIDFSKCKFEEYPEKSIQEILLNTPELGELTFFSGRAKCVFTTNFDKEFVYKIPYIPEKLDAALKVYSLAKEQDLHKFFLSHELVYECGLIKIFKQPMVTTLWSYYQTHVLEKITKNQQLYEIIVNSFKDFYPPEIDFIYFFNWSLRANEKYGINQSLNLIDFCVKNYIADIAGTPNLGFDKNGNPVIIDYDDSLHYIPYEKPYSYKTQFKENNKNRIGIKTRKYQEGGNDMKFPCWSDYDSVYEGVDLEIHIVDHCNLNCAGCNHFCPLAEPYYIEPEYLRAQLKMAKEKIPSIRWIMLLGGEPTIHPQLLELCKITREIFPDPNIQVEILTNGKDLTPIVNDITEFEKENISVTVAIYDIDYNQEHLDKICHMERGGISWGRESFSQTLVDVTGSQDMEQSFFKNCHHQLPCFTLKDFKIYECPFAAHISAFKKKFNVDIPDIEGVDYLSLETLTLDALENFSYQPKNICKYCKPGQGWVWHRSDRTYQEFTETVNELYFSNYPLYEKIQNLNNPIKNEAVKKVIDPNFGLSVAKSTNVRYNGKIDIIIPFYNVTQEVAQRLKNTLKKQTIIQDCAIYFISDQSPNDKEIFYFFNNRSNDKTDLNVFFLKNTERSGPGAGRNKGIENSFNKYLFFLDADDEFSSPDVLEKLYNTAEQYKSEVVLVNRTAGGKRIHAQDVFCTREYLNNNNIRYGNFFVHEDLMFMLQLESLGGRVIKVGYNGIMYHGEYNQNISHTIPTKVKAWNKLFCTYNFTKIMKEKNLYTGLIGQHFLDFTCSLDKILSDLYPNPQENQKKEIQDVVLFAFFIVDFMYDCFPKELDEVVGVDNPPVWVKQIKNNDYSFKNYMIETKDDLKSYIYNCINEFESSDKIYMDYIKNFIFKEEP